jgi:hypothetical protein
VLTDGSAVKVFQPRKKTPLKAQTATAASEANRILSAQPLIAAAADDKGGKVSAKETTTMSVAVAGKTGHHAFPDRNTDYVANSAAMNEVAVVDDDSLQTTSIATSLMAQFSAAASASAPLSSSTSSASITQAVLAGSAIVVVSPSPVKARKPRSASNLTAESPVDTKLVPGQTVGVNSQLTHAVFSNSIVKSKIGALSDNASVGGRYLSYSMIVFILILHMLVPSYQQPCR